MRNYNFSLVFYLTCQFGDKWFYKKFGHCYKNNVDKFKTK